MNLQFCTTCQAQLDDASIKAGRCPVCGAPTVATTLHTVQDLSQPGTSVTQDPSGSSTSEDSSERSLEHPRKDSSLSGQTTNPNNATVDLSPADTAADLGPLMGSQDGTASANSNEDKPAENETDAEPSKKSGTAALANASARVRISFGESLSSEVCSIYLVREGVLELFATRGLKQEAVPGSGKLV